ncbi:MAG: YjiH family protein [Proteobacteria bacterium]|nr:YjiH family protein [Pseudomonadota bacterium]
MNGQRNSSREFLAFLLSTFIGLGFFLLPVQLGDRTTIPFDVLTSSLVTEFPGLVKFWATALFVTGIVGSVGLLADQSRHDGQRWFHFLGTSRFMAVTRIFGGVLALAMGFDLAPQILLGPDVKGVMWGKLGLTVGIIVPVGAMTVALLLHYGALEFFGALMRPVMRPLFKLPGRSALDDLMSWLGPYAVGFYFTRKLMDRGLYTRRQTFTVATCFCTISIGFVAVIASTLDILHLFSQIFVTYFIAVYGLAAILVRMWPITAIPETYTTTPQPEPDEKKNLMQLAKEGLRDALLRASMAPPLSRIFRDSLVEGIQISATILGSIVGIGTMALLLAHHTDMFHWLGAPLILPLTWIGAPEPARLAPAIMAGFTEVYVPSLLVKDAAIQTRFFICVMSISQLLFFSSVVPVLIEVFRAIPARIPHLIALFFLRTLLLIPFLTVATKIFVP